MNMAVKIVRYGRRVGGFGQPLAISDLARRGA